MNYCSMQPWIHQILDLLEAHFGSSVEFVVHDLTLNYEHTIVDIRNGEITGLAILEIFLVCRSSVEQKTILMIIFIRISLSQRMDGLFVPPRYFCAIRKEHLLFALPLMKILQNIPNSSVCYKAKCKFLLTLQQTQASVRGT